MNENPILFSEGMVKAILDGRKTQTRRAVKLSPQLIGYLGFVEERQKHLFKAEPHFKEIRCPYGKAGNKLWVRETWQYCHECGGVNYLAYANKGPHCQHCDAFLGKWKPSIHMPRSHSRITLEVVKVKVEQVQAISQGDAKAEGVKPLTLADGGFVPVSGSDYVGAFRNLWNEINGKRGYTWESNPWVWVVEFKRAD